MAVKLERLDQALRLFRGMPITGEEVPDNSKVTIYQFGKTKDIGRLIDADGVAGFFIPRASGSVAFVPLEEEGQRPSRSSPGTRDQVEFYNYDLPPEEVLFHEYTHYFMFQHAPAAYPFWYIEGLAELFGAIELVENGFNLGDVPESRRGLIQRFDVEYEMLFDPPERVSYIDVLLGYAHGWLATSYLSFEPTRQGQLANYLQLINAGRESIEAAREAFGDLKQLEKELNDYRKERARGISVQFPALSQPDITVRQLSADESARMELHVQQNAGVTETKARRLLPDARELAAQYPNSVPVLLTALEAEFDTDNLMEAQQMAERVLAIDPESVTGTLYLARVALKHAEQQPAYLAVARNHFISANQLDSKNPEALAGYYRTFALAGETPPEDALIALENAYFHAPFDNDIRFTLAHLLLTENRDSEAVLLLSPIVNSPHASKMVRKYRDLVAKLEAGDRQPLIDALAPSLEEKED
jgi:tetratricopeptide (TPR) repeat protein